MNSSRQRTMIFATTHENPQTPQNHQANTCTRRVAQCFPKKGKKTISDWAWSIETGSGQTAHPIFTILWFSWCVTQPLPLCSIDFTVRSVYRREKQSPPYCQHSISLRMGSVHTAMGQRGVNSCWFSCWMFSCYLWFSW